MLKTTLPILTILLSIHAASAATLKPIQPETFFVQPDQPVTLRWQVISGALDGRVQAVVHDYHDHPVATLPAKIAPEGELELTIQLPAGFYQLEIPAADQRFGVAALPAFEGQTDPFFSIDAAMSWLVRDDLVRESLIRVLRRTGVAMSRERLNWAQINPAKDEWDWESPLHYETLRKTYAAHDVDLLEMFHGTTGWTGSIEKYPDDLIGTARAWSEIGRRWCTTWDAMEVWNEPDIFFGGNLPADQYACLVKTFAYTFARRGIDVPLVGGVFAHHNRPFLDNAARNGLIDSVDVVSFHTYGRAPAMEDLIQRYRSWLADHGREAMPLWLTECGRPWKQGPDRPPADQDAESALDVTMKAVESRACGIARYFAFVYPFYEEQGNNFGLMGRRATPLRSMAAYARLTRLLAHKPYLGDLGIDSGDDASVRRARVFADDRETIAVLYTGRPDPETKWELGLPVLRAEGIDGRALDVAEGGVVPVPDGLAYVWLDRDELGDRLQTDTPAVRLWRIGLAKPPRPETPSPIVLRYQFSADEVEAKSEGYRVKAAAPMATALKVRVFNLAEEPRQLKLEANLAPGGFSDAGSSRAGLEKQVVHVPGEGFVDVDWRLDLGAAFAADGRASVEVIATDRASSQRVDTLRIDLSGEATLDQVLNRYQHHRRLPIEQTAAWRPSIVGHGEMSIDATPDGPWRLTARFGEGDRWVYPFFQLPGDVDVSRFSAIALRGRSLRPATVRVFFWEGDGGVGYLTPAAAIPADGNWHTAVVRFEDLMLSGANAPDPNGRLDLDEVKRVSIGFNAQSAENTLEISDVYLLGSQ